MLKVRTAVMNGPFKRDHIASANRRAAYSAKYASFETISIGNFGQSRTF